MVSGKVWPILRSVKQDLSSSGMLTQLLLRGKSMVAMMIVMYSNCPTIAAAANIVATYIDPDQLMMHIDDSVLQSPFTGRTVPQVNIPQDESATTICMPREHYQPTDSNCFSE